MIYLDTVQLIFIIFAPAVALLVIFYVVMLVWSKLYEKNKFNKYCYKKINRVVLNNDFYLINNFIYFFDQTRSIKVDHIMFSDKYIYVCFDNYFEGNIMGKDTDTSLIFISRDGEKKYIDNAFLSMNRVLKQLASATGLPTDLLIGITITNNGCQSKIESQSNQFFLIQANKFSKLIKTIESRDVAKLDAKALDKAVKTIHSINEREKKKMA